MRESKLQAEIISWLRSKGCYVIKHPAVPGVPVGTADISFYYEGFYGFLEVKAAKTSKVQPLQREFIKKMDDWSWARFVDPSNWEETKVEIEQML